MPRWCSVPLPITPYYYVVYLAVFALSVIFSSLPLEREPHSFFACLAKRWCRVQRCVYPNNATIITHQSSTPLMARAGKLDACKAGADGLDTVNSTPLPIPFGSSANAATFIPGGRSSDCPKTTRGGYEFTLIRCRRCRWQGACRWPCVVVLRWCALVYHMTIRQRNATRSHSLT